MAKFNALNYKRDLKNAQHFAFIQAFITALTAADFTAQKIAAKLALLVSAFAEEDSCNTGGQERCVYVPAS